MAACRQHHRNKFCFSLHTDKVGMGPCEQPGGVVHVHIFTVAVRRDLSKGRPLALLALDGAARQPGNEPALQKNVGHHERSARNGDTGKQC